MDSLQFARVHHPVEFVADAVTESRLPPRSELIQETREVLHVSLEWTK